MWWARERERDWHFVFSSSSMLLYVHIGHKGLLGTATSTFIQLQNCVCVRMRANLQVKGVVDLCRMINDLTDTAVLSPPPTAIAMTAPKTRMKNARLTCIQNRENTEPSLILLIYYLVTFKCVTVIDTDRSEWSHWRSSQCSYKDLTFQITDSTTGINVVIFIYYPNNNFGLQRQKDLSYSCQLTL